MKQHVTFVELHQFWEHPTGVWIQHLRIEVGFQGVEEEDTPSGGFGGILLASNGDGGD